MKISNTNIAQTVIAIYSSNIENLVDYYKEALNLELIEKGDGYICLGRAEIEVNLLKMNGKPSRSIEVEKKFTIREETPIKCSFVVDSFEQVRQANLKYGGGLKNEEEAWRWRGAIHLDGHDPEGNVVQFRVLNK